MKTPKKKNRLDIGDASGSIVTHFSIQTPDGGFVERVLRDPKHAAKIKDAVLKAIDGGTQVEVSVKPKGVELTIDALKKAADRFKPLTDAVKMMGATMITTARAAANMSAAMREFGTSVAEVNDHIADAMPLTYAPGTPIRIDDATAPAPMINVDASNEDPVYVMPTPGTASGNVLHANGSGELSWQPEPLPWLDRPANMVPVRWDFGPGRVITNPIMPDCAPTKPQPKEAAPEPPACEPRRGFFEEA